MNALQQPSHLSPVPLYTQVRELLRERILHGIYKSHTQIPSEHEMVRAFGVSRITVRQALTELQKEGLIFKIHGKGTFVSKPKATQHLRRLEGFGEAMASAGHETFSKVLGHRVKRAGRVVGGRLRLSERDEVMEIKRIRHLNGEAISLDVTYVPVTLGKRLVREDLAHRDIFAILEADYGIALGNAELCVDSTLADDEVAAALKIDAGSPILRINRLTFTMTNDPLDFEYVYFRGDAFQYQLHIERHSASAAQRKNPLEKIK